AEYRQFPHWGHSTPVDAMEIANEAGAKTLALFHHAPARSDDELDAILADCRKQAKKLDVIAAKEGLEVELKNGPTNGMVRGWKSRSGACADRFRRQGRKPTATAATRPACRYAPRPAISSFWTAAPAS